MKLVIATTSAGKVREFSYLLKGFECVGLSELPSVPTPEENGRTFQENSRLKAEYYFKALKMPVICDDSGFCVRALGGAPGVFSARWAEEQGGFAPAMKEILKELEGKPERAAFFECALCFISATGEVYESSGIVSGSVATEIRGVHGFGYDGVFIPQGSAKTFAEMTSEEKNAYSHRSIALKKLVNGVLRAAREA